MTGINKYDGKDKRRARLQMAAQKGRNHIAKDLGSPKYGQRIVPDRKRVESTRGNYYFIDEYFEDYE